MQTESKNSPGGVLVYVGTYTDPILFGSGEVFQGKGEGIYIYSMDRSTGGMTLVNTVRGVTNPSYLAFDPSGRFAYAVNELKEYEGKASGSVSSFAVEQDGHNLRFLNKQPTGGTDPCHVVVDRWGKHLFVANFMSGSVSVYPRRPDGSIGPATHFIQHTGSGHIPKRQAGPHAHSTVLDHENRYAFIPDLGLDRLMIYRYDGQRGMLRPNETPWVQTKPGAGPRHLALHPSRPFAYLINELDSTIGAYRYDGASGSFELLETVSTLPAGYTGASTCADINVDPLGDFLYGSNRGHDSVVIFRIDGATGRLAYVGHESTRGKVPRNFAIDPAGRFLLAANQNTDTIEVFAIDRSSGKLSHTGNSVMVPTPVCVRFRPEQ
ncbi:MAG TPA: lactonase family protein [Spirochaetia bacterium]|nr:lactonase family protein [Spirochaetia bacterium]